MTLFETRMALDIIITYEMLYIVCKFLGLDVYYSACFLLFSRGLQKKKKKFKVKHKTQRVPIEFFSSLPREFEPGQWLYDTGNGLFFKSLFIFWRTGKNFWKEIYMLYRHTSSWLKEFIIGRCVQQQPSMYFIVSLIHFFLPGFFGIFFFHQLTWTILV